MLNYKSYKADKRRAGLLISCEARKLGLYDLLENVKNHAEKCRSNGLIDEYIAAIADVDRLEITIEELDEQ